MEGKVSLKRIKIRLLDRTMVSVNEKVEWANDSNIKMLTNDCHTIGQGHNDLIRYYGGLWLMIMLTMELMSQMEE
jgi:hypothetical protein